MKVLLSTSALTESNVADLQAIHDRMQVLTDRAEGILRKANEVFPAAQSGWLRRIKSALGMLPVKDCHTLEDTITFCQRLVSNSMDFVEPLEWAGKHKYVLKYRHKIIKDVIPNKAILISVYQGNKFIGTLSKYQNRWIYVAAALDFPKDVDFSKSDLRL